jgi:HEPN domain-containing protein
MLWEDVCFDAQQAVKKALKALLTLNGVPFRFTQVIAALLTALEKVAIDIPSVVRSATLLTDYAVSTRYPGTAEPVSEADISRPSPSRPQRFTGSNSD